MAEQPDLFNLGGVEQLSLFVEEDGPPAVLRFTPEPDEVRRRLRRLLDQARDASTMPWPERDARMWQAVFPQMANWLPEDEANQLRFEFAQEIERLKAA
ncbi:MAG TPA: hypothetical protein VG939_05095 [Caulobacteraceae bacterium]|nr:hypothetical protein [Caulobacteraceae bacterium]